MGGGAATLDKVCASLTASTVEQAPLPIKCVSWVDAPEMLTFEVLALWSRRISELCVLTPVDAMERTALDALREEVCSLDILWISNQKVCATAHAPAPKLRTGERVDWEVCNC